MTRQLQNKIVANLRELARRAADKPNTKDETRARTVTLYA